MRHQNWHHADIIAALKKHGCVVPKGWPFLIHTGKRAYPTMAQR